MGMLVNIGKAAKALGVHPETLWRWEKEGKIPAPLRTSGGTRRYDVDRLCQVAPKRITVSRTTVAYARVSSHDQKEDLSRQAERLRSFCTANGWTFDVIQDLGSGMNYQKKGLQDLLGRICAGEVERLVLTHKDRLLRFGADLIFSLCDRFGTDVVLIEATEGPSFEAELVQDVLEIITVVSARLYGSRSHKHKTLMDCLQEVTKP